jgi:hypothetical protein
MNRLIKEASRKMCQGYVHVLDRKVGVLVTATPALTEVGGDELSP